MRLLLVGAFPYPLGQGSQIYFQEQAQALRGAGARVEMLTYASGRPGSGVIRALEGFAHHTPPAWTAPSELRSGPAWGKPLADIALAKTLRDAVASKSRHDAFDAVLTHNAEACVTALLGLRGIAIPIVYCLHTLLGQELSAYLKPPKIKDNSDFVGYPRGLARLLDRGGRSLDRLLARRVDGWIALTQTASRVMRQYSNAPGELIAPPIPDPEDDRERPDPADVARRHGLEPNGFFLYSGNLDGYQELAVLGAAAERLTRATPESASRPVLVLASHDPAGAAVAGAMAGVVFRHIAGAREMQALLSAARANLLMRRARGGYPIKLANAHAAGTPTIAFRDREWGLLDERNCLIASLERPASSLATAITRLAADDALAARLRVGARALYRAQHRPEQAASHTLDLLEAVLATRRGRGTRSTRADR
jgi:glycosyltransferase involved in cell wall biosynthesis